MSELQDWEGFDAQERERVRSALHGYMQDEGIGTPALRDRIIKADKPRHRDIPLSTLQRFIARKHHTQGHHVALCQAFVKKLRQYQEGRDVTQLGDALASFFPLRWPEHEDSTAEGPDRFCWGYSGFTHRKRPAHERMYVPDKQERYVVPYAELTFSRDGNTSYLRVQETITNIGLDYPFSQGQTQATYTYEGIFAAFGPMLRIMLRNNLTRQPRFYELEEAGPGVLYGHARESSFLTDTQGNELTTYMACKLSPESGPDQ